MKFKEEKEQLVKLGMKKQKVIDMEKKRDKIKRNIQKMKTEQSLKLMPNKLYQIKGQEINEKTEKLKELEQNIKDVKILISEQIEHIKSAMQDKIIGKMAQYEEELTSGDKKHKSKYIQLNYTLARLNNLDYDSLPVFENGDEKDNQRENDKGNIDEISVREER